MKENKRKFLKILLGKPISFGKPNPYAITVTDSIQTNIKTPIAVKNIILVHS